MKNLVTFTFLGLSLVSVVNLQAQQRKKPRAQSSKSSAVNRPVANSSSANVSANLSRAEVLDRMGLHYVALAERIEAGYRSPSSRVLTEIGNSALGLSRFDSASRLATSLISRGANTLNWPASFRMALAAHELRLGNLLGAARWIPRKEQLMGISDPNARLKAFTVASGILYGLDRPSQALDVLSSNFSKVPNRDMGFIYLQRARVNFEVKRYSNALDELLLLPKTSPSWFDGTIVSAWAAYHVDDLNLTLGQLMNVHSPFLKNKFRPESYLLEAATLYRLCYFDSANRSIKKLREKYQPLVADIRRLQSMSGSSVMGYALKFSAGETNAPSAFDNKNWPILMDGLLGQPSLAEVDQGLAQIKREEVLSASLTGRTKQKALNEFAAAKKEFFNFGSGYAKNRVNRMMQEISESLEGVLSVEVEVTTRLRERLISGKTGVRKNIDFEKEVQKGYEFWPFEGEFWRDETGGYAFATSNVCADNEVL